MRQYPIVREVSNLLIGPILIFALYVQFHGDFGPGGGFQAGVILAAAFILYALVYGLEQLQRCIPPPFVHALVAGGVLLYAGTGLLCLFKGGTFLDYNVLMHDPLHGQHWGIFAIEVGVGLTVGGVMLTIFYQFTKRRDVAE